MEVLDTTVVNVSLPHIAGSLSASVDEATWVLTSYLVANAIVLPMTGWLANYFGRKRMLQAAVFGFTAASVLCGMAQTLPMLICFRIVQGATGGALQPLSQAVMLEAFPSQDRGKAMAFWGLGIVVAPMLGPVIGGWLTDNYSWRWVFYINVPIGVASLVLTQLFIFDPPYLRRQKTGIDYWGIGLLAVGIGSLQIMLDKGQEDDWFGSRFIVTLCILAVGGLTALIIRELKAKHPVLDLTVFKYRSFAIGTFLMTLIGFVLYGSTVLLPLLMQVLLGYTATHAGITNLPRGLASFLIMPIVGRLIGKFDQRKLLGVGLVASAYAMWSLSRFSLDVASVDFWWPLLIQGAALGFVFVPLTTITNGTIPNERMGNATSLFNLMRNIGASIGIASVETLQFRNQQKHIATLSAHVYPENSAAHKLFESLKALFMGQGSSAATATQQAYQSMWGMVQRQAAMLSYNDTFFFMALMFVAMIPFLFLLRKPKGKAGAAAVH
jgi:DHA2 family multidrug resistance protein